MNTKCIELTNVLYDNEVTNIKSGIQVLDDFFKQFEFHPMKEEYMKMNKKEKSELVILLMDTDTDNTGDSSDSDGVYGETNNSECNDIAFTVAPSDIVISEEFIDIDSGEEIAPVKTNKAQLAREYFDANKNLTRKEIIQYFQTTIGLTKAGSNTYYQNLKKKSV